MLKFLNNYLTLLIVLSIAYIFAFYLANMQAINNALIEVSKHYEFWNFFGEISMTLIELFMAVFILKFLLGTQPFKEEIKKIFRDIFMEHSFLSGVDKNTLLSLAANVQKANSGIVFQDKTKEYESIEALENFFYKGNNKFVEKNYIVLHSDYVTTLLSTGVEIVQRKIKCKIMKEGRFCFKYNFIPPDKCIDPNRYLLNIPGERFTDYAYNDLLKTSDPSNAYLLEREFSTTESNNLKWIQIEFSKFKTMPGEIIEIEFSITNKFILEKREEIEQHYESVYTYPHAIRNITFQLEKYKDFKEGIPDITPHLVIGDEHVKERYKENIYYQIYSWQVNYVENQNKEVKFQVV